MKEREKKKKVSSTKETILQQIKGESMDEKINGESRELAFEKYMFTDEDDEPSAGSGRKEMQRIARNCSEKKRKDKIKLGIRKISELLPEAFKSPKDNYVTMLDKTVNFIEELKEQNAMLLVGEKETAQEQEINRLQQQVTSLEKQLKESNDLFKELGPNFTVDLAKSVSMWRGKETTNKQAMDKTMKKCIAAMMSSMEASGEHADDESEDKLKLFKPKKKKGDKNRNTTVGEHLAHGGDSDPGLNFNIFPPGLMPDGAQFPMPCLPGLSPGGQPVGASTGSLPPAALHGNMPGAGGQTVPVLTSTGNIVFLPQSAIHPVPVTSSMKTPSEVPNSEADDDVQSQTSFMEMDIDATSTPNHIKRDEDDKVGIKESMDLSDNPLLDHEIAALSRSLHPESTTNSSVFPGLNTGVTMSSSEISKFSTAMSRSALNPSSALNSPTISLGSQSGGLLQIPGNQNLSQIPALGSIGSSLPVGSLQNINTSAPSVPSGPFGPNQQMQGTIIMQNGQLMLIGKDGTATPLPFNPNVPVSAMAPSSSMGLNLTNNMAPHVSTSLSVGTTLTPSTGIKMASSVNTGQVPNLTGIPGQTGALPVGTGALPVGGIPGMPGQAPLPLQSTAGAMGSIPGLQTQNVMINGQQQTVQVVPNQGANSQGNNNQTVTVNTPQGQVTMNTTPSQPNQLPSALILPNGQIVPVVTQPQMLFPQNQCMPVNGGLLMANSQGQQGVMGGSQIGQPLQGIPGKPGPMVMPGMPQQVINQGLIAPGAIPAVRQQPTTIRLPNGMLATVPAGSPMVRPFDSSALRPPLIRSGANTVHHLPNSMVPGAVANQSMVLGSPAAQLGSKALTTVSSVNHNISGQGVIQPIFPQGIPQGISSSGDASSTTTTTESKTPIGTSSSVSIPSLPPTLTAMLTPEGNIIIMPVSAPPTSSTSTSTTAVAGQAAGKNSKKNPRILKPKPSDSGTEAESMLGSPAVPSPGSGPPGSNLNPGSESQASAISPGAAGGRSSDTDILATAAASIFSASNISPGFYGSEHDDDNPLQIDTANAEHAEDGTDKVHSQMEPPAAPKVKPKRPPKKKQDSASKSKKATKKDKAMGNESGSDQSGLLDGPQSAEAQLLEQLADKLDEEEESDITDFSDLIKMHVDPPLMSKPDTSKSDIKIENQTKQPGERSCSPVIGIPDASLLPSMPHLVPVHNKQKSPSHESGVEKSETDNMELPVLSAAESTPPFSELNFLCSIAEKQSAKQDNSLLPDLTPQIQSEQTEIPSQLLTHEQSPAHIFPHHQLPGLEQLSQQQPAQQEQLSQQQQTQQESQQQQPQQQTLLSPQPPIQGNPPPSNEFPPSSDPSGVFPPVVTQQSGIPQPGLSQVPAVSQPMVFPNSLATPMSQPPQMPSLNPDIISPAVPTTVPATPTTLPADPTTVPGSTPPSGKKNKSSKKDKKKKEKKKNKKDREAERNRDMGPPILLPELPTGQENMLPPQNPPSQDSEKPPKEKKKKKSKKKDKDKEHHNPPPESSTREQKATEDNSFISYFNMDQPVPTPMFYNMPDSVHPPDILSHDHVHVDTVLNETETGLSTTGESSTLDTSLDTTGTEPMDVDDKGKKSKSKSKRSRSKKNKEDVVPPNIPDTGSISSALLSEISANAGSAEHTETERTPGGQLSTTNESAGDDLDQNKADNSLKRAHVRPEDVIPETITFSENDLDAILNQVESFGETLQQVGKKPSTKSSIKDEDDQDPVRSPPAKRKRRTSGATDRIVIIPSGKKDDERIPEEKLDEIFGKRDPSRERKTDIVPRDDPDIDVFEFDSGEVVSGSQEDEESSPVRKSEKKEKKSKKSKKKKNVVDTSNESIDIGSSVPPVVSQDKEVIKEPSPIPLIDSIPERASPMKLIDTLNAAMNQGIEDLSQPSQEKTSVSKPVDSFNTPRTETTESKDKSKETSTSSSSLDKEEDKSLHYLHKMPATPGSARHSNIFSMAQHMAPPKYGPIVQPKTPKPAPPPQPVINPNPPPPTSTSENRSTSASGTCTTRDRDPSSKSDVLSAGRSKEHDLASSLPDELDIPDIVEENARRESELRQDNNRDSSWKMNSPSYKKPPVEKNTSRSPGKGMGGQGQDPFVAPSLNLLNNHPDKGMHAAPMVENIPPMHRNRSPAGMGYSTDSPFSQQNTKQSTESLNMQRNAPNHEPQSSQGVLKPCQDNQGPSQGGSLMTGNMNSEPVSSRPRSSAGMYGPPPQGPPGSSSCALQGRTLDHYPFSPPPFAPPSASNAPTSRSSCSVDASNNDVPFSLSFTSTGSTSTTSNAFDSRHQFPFYFPMGQNKGGLPHGPPHGPISSASSMSSQMPSAMEISPFSGSNPTNMDIPPSSKHGPVHNTMDRDKNLGHGMGPAQNPVSMSGNMRGDSSNKSRGREPSRPASSLPPPPHLSHPDKDMSVKGMGQSNSATRQPTPTHQAPQNLSKPRSSSIGRSPQDGGYMGGSGTRYPSQSPSNIPATSTSLTSPPLHHPRPQSEPRSANTRPGYESHLYGGNGPPTQFSPVPPFPYDPPPLHFTKESMSSSYPQPRSSNSNPTSKQRQSQGHSSQGHGSKSLSHKQSSSQQPPSSHHAAQQSHHPSQNPHQSSQPSSKSTSSRSTSKSSKKSSSSNSTKQLQHFDSDASGSMFDPSRSMTPYFPITNLSPQPRNMPPDGPTYLPGHFFGNSGRPLSNANSLQHKDSSQLPFNQLFPPSRAAQNGIGLNFQASPFPMNHMHGNHSSPSQISQHSSAVSMAPHMPNFNLTNFLDMSNPGQSEISPMKFGPGIPPQGSGMDHSALQHHHQAAGQLYHNRSQVPPPMLHNVSALNSFLGHQHGFDGRAMGPGMNSAMGGPFVGPGHGPSFGMPHLNFPMHEH